MASRHDSRKLTGNIKYSSIRDTCSGSILAREDGASVNRLTLRVDIRIALVESLGRGEPLESRGSGRGGEEDEEGGVIG